MYAKNDTQLKELENAMFQLNYEIEKSYNNYKREQQIKEIVDFIQHNKVEIYTLSLFFIIALIISIIYIKLTKEKE